MERSVLQAVLARLEYVGLRPTATRRRLVEILARAAAPLTVPEIISAGTSGPAPVHIPASSAYRNIVHLERAGVVRRIVTSDLHARFELSETLTGDHHHHLVCTLCGRVSDIALPDQLEAALEGTIDRIGRDLDFDVTEHRLDLVGACRDCRR